MSTRQVALLALVLALPAPGCCTLARLFCGPDDSEWVQIDFRTPEAGLATFMEAVRRDRCRVIYDSLAETFKDRARERGVPGMDLATSCVFWEHLKDQQSGLHLLGYAQVKKLQPDPLDPLRAAFELEYSGYRFQVDLVEQQLWAVYTDLEHARELSRFAPVFEPGGDPATRIGVVQWPREDGESLVIVLPDPATIGPIVGLDDVQEISITREWKVDDFQQLPDSD